LVAALAVPALLRGVPAAQAGATTSYLALGTSLAVGFQPGRGETRNGYVDDLYRRMQQQIDGLSLRNVGCPGETSRSMISGDGSPCSFAAGSQLDAAVAFLEAHSGSISFITIDVGANDLLNHCLRRDGLVSRSCAVDLAPHLASRVADIVDALTGAAPDVPVIGMTYYNPFLGVWNLVPGGHRLARADQRAWAVFDDRLTTAYRDAGAAVADVAAIYRIDDFTQTVAVPGIGRIPVNVALACRWTWFCSKRFFGDPHPNRLGYQRIAGTYLRELRGVLTS